jgi:hypothetical protein
MRRCAAHATKMSVCLFVRTGPVVKDKSNSGADGTKGQRTCELCGGHEPPLPPGPWPRTATATVEAPEYDALCLTRCVISRPTFASTSPVTWYSPMLF